MDSVLVISNVVLWVAVIGLSVLVFALTRQIGVLYERVAPAGALMVNQQLKVGDTAPTMTVESLTGEKYAIGGNTDHSRLLFFLAPDCPICKTLLPVLKSVQKNEADWVDVVLASDGGRLSEHEQFVAAERLESMPYVLSEILGKRYGVGKLPYGVLIDEDGKIASFGLVNSREHLESLFEAKERKVASIQQFLEERSGDYYDASENDEPMEKSR
jgi:methylamine dehydrogenase accessory protein MauD